MRFSWWQRDGFAPFGLFVGDDDRHFGLHVVVPFPGDGKLALGRIPVGSVPSFGDVPVPSGTDGRHGKWRSSGGDVSEVAVFPSAFLDSGWHAASNIRAFHMTQMPNGENLSVEKGIDLSRRIVPIHTVGLYIPGGTAPLFSTVLMLSIPAKVAGCQRIVLCTPPGSDGKVNPAILFAASVGGVGEIYKAGGAQAIAAMAYGTESIPKADKIFGPGNRFVMDGGWEVYVDGGRTPTGKAVLAWAKEVYERGAGEILLTSMDHDGTKSGFAVELTRMISTAVGIPVIASGGAGTMEHFRDVFMRSLVKRILLVSPFLIIVSV